MEDIEYPTLQMEMLNTATIIMSTSLFLNPKEL